jgi:hypothetical protein
LVNTQRPQLLLAGRALANGIFTSKERLVKKTIPPEKALRGIALFCLVAMGVVVIYRVKSLSSTPYAAQLSETGVYLFLAMCLFGIFYGEYHWVPRILKRPLNITLGFVQTFLCLALLLFGLLPVWQPDWGVSGAFGTDNMIVTIAVLGEALFAVNVCWTLLQPAPPVVPVAGQASAPASISKTAPAAQTVLPYGAVAKNPRFNFKRWTNPENPMEKFGVTSIFLFVGGIAMFFVLPDSQFLILFGGQNHFLPMGFLWWACAVPFGIYSLAYWLHAGRRSASYDKYMTKIHLAVTFVWLLDFVRIVTHSQWSMTSRLPDLLMDNYTFELYVLLGATVAMFFVNVRAAARSRSATK